jgi:predicted nucleic acid-binding protein
VTTAYVESSALVKLVHAEPETDALRGALGSEDALVSSDLAVVEVSRAVTLSDGDEGLARSRAALLRFNLLPVDRLIIEDAATLSPATLRSLDAIHVATARALDAPDLVFYSYDSRTIEAARSNGLVTASPGARA